MTLVDFIDLDYDEQYVKVDVIDLSSDDDSVKNDGNVENKEGDDDNVPQSENLAEAAPSLPISEQDATAATSLSMVDRGSNMSSLMAVKFMQPEKQECLATSYGAKEGTQPVNHEFNAAADCMGEAMQSEHEAGIVLSMTEQNATTSLLLTNQGGSTTSLREDKSMQSGNQVFVAAVDCAKQAIQSENTVNAAGSPSLTERGGQLCQMIVCPHIVRNGLGLSISHGGGHPHGEPGCSIVLCTKSEVSTGVRGDAGNAIGSTGIDNIHAREESEGDAEKDENCDIEEEIEAPSPHDKQKQTSQFMEFCDRKEKEQANTSATECTRQLSILHTEGVPPTLHNGDSGLIVMGIVRNGTARMGSNILDGEGVMCTYQECNKTFEGNTTMYGKVRDSGSTGCTVEGCTKSAHGATPLCIFHNSRPHKRCCTVIGCTKAARSQGRTDCCMKHGGGKRCKHDGCGKGAIGKTDYCSAHGGGRRCKFQGCRKGALGRTYCMKHGGGKRCKFPGCSASAKCGQDRCSMHITCMLSGNTSSHEMLPAPACRAKKAESSKTRNSHTITGGSSRKRQNTNGYVNSRSFNIFETGEKKGTDFIWQNNMLKTQQTTGRMNS